jgi:hypothetical protein
MTVLITGLIGVAGLVAFLGVMIWWIKALPLAIIMAGVVLMMLYDFVQTLRFGENWGEK